MMFLSLLLLLMLPTCSCQEANYFGTVATFYPKQTTNGSLTVVFRYKLNFQTCTQSDTWDCLNLNCGTEISVELHKVYNESSGEWCQREGIMTRQLPVNSEDLSLELFSGNWTSNINGFTQWFAEAYMELGTRSDTGQTNRPCQTTILPVLRVPSNCQRDFNLLAFDPDGDEVECFYTVLPSVISLSSSCLLSFSPTNSSNEGSYAVELEMLDLPRQTITLNRTIIKTPDDSLSEVPVQFVFKVDPVVPSCTEGLYLPKFLPPTPVNRAQLYTPVDQTLEISIKAEANNSTISELLFSGPYNVNQTTSGAGQFILRWTPSEDQDGESYPICFVAQAVNNSDKYHSELRCVIVTVGNKSTSNIQPPAIPPTTTSIKMTTTAVPSTTPPTTTVIESTTQNMSTPSTTTLSTTPPSTTTLSTTPTSTTTLSTTPTSTTTLSTTPPSTTTLSTTPPSTTTLSTTPPSTTPPSTTTLSTTPPSTTTLSTTPPSTTTLSTTPPSTTPPSTTTLSTTPPSTTTLSTTPPSTTTLSTTPLSTTPPSTTTLSTTPPSTTMLSTTPPSTTTLSTTPPSTTPPSTTTLSTTPPRTTTLSTTPLSTTPSTTTLSTTTLSTTPPSTTKLSTTPPSTTTLSTTPPRTTTLSTTPLSTTPPSTTTLSTTTLSTTPPSTTTLSTTPPSTTTLSTTPPSTTPPSTTTLSTTPPHTTTLSTTPLSTTPPSTTPSSPTTLNTTTPSTTTPEATTIFTTPDDTTLSPATVIDIVNQNVVGLRIKISSLSELSDEDIRTTVLQQLKDELVRRGLPPNITLSFERRV